MRHARDTEYRSPWTGPLTARGYIDAVLLGAMIKCRKWAGTPRLPVAASDLPRAKVTARLLFGRDGVTVKAALREAASADVPPRDRGADWVGDAERWCDVVVRVRTELAKAVEAGEDAIWVAHSCVMDAALEVLCNTCHPAELDPGFMWALVVDVKSQKGAFDNPQAPLQSHLTYFGPLRHGLRYLIADR